MKPRIYHNPHCSKSRAAMALLEDRGLELEVVEYLATPPTPATLRNLVAKLGVPAKKLVRTGETAFREAHIDLDSATDDAILEFLAREPSALQRPIVEFGANARIGRPPEAVLEIFQ
ncbi:MAG TPA: arsenate reductase (glutaredoxin) [Gammaproteobacteria bacterium]